MGSLTACGLELIREGTKMRDDVWAEGFEEGEELASNPHPEVTRVCVGWIARERDGVPGDVREDGAVRRAEERTGPRETRERRGGRAWGKRRETEWARAAEESEEDRLGAIVGVVTGGDDACGDRRGGGLERVVASLPRACLNVSPFFDIDHRARERDDEGAREFLRSVQLPRSFGPQSVINAVCEEDVPDVVPQRGEHVEKRHRVGPAAHGDEHAIALGK